MQRQRQPSTGAWADREAVLRAVEAESPAAQVLWTLRRLLTASRAELLTSRDLTGARLLALHARKLPIASRAAAFSMTEFEALRASALALELRRWGERSHLVGLRDGRPAGEWVLRVAADTLHFWAVSRLHSHRFLFDGAAWGDVKIGAPAGNYRSRAKLGLGQGVEFLRTRLSPGHLAAFVGYQICGDTLKRAGERWAEADNRALPVDPTNVRHRIHEVAERLDLPLRPPRGRGQPRRHRGG